MASPLALAAVGMTVLRLIETHCPRDEFTATPDFKLFHPGDFTEPSITEGFSLAIWRVAINTTGRAQAPRRRPDGSRRRPALPLDLQFMLTPWAGEPERQLRLLGWAMRFLEDNPILPAALLNQSLTRRERPAFDPDEAVELFCDPLPIADYLGLWDKYKPRWQPSMTYGARMLMIDSDIAQPDGAPVQIRQFDVGREGAP